MLALIQVSTQFCKKSGHQRAVESRPHRTKRRKDCQIGKNGKASFTKCCQTGEEERRKSDRDVDSPFRSETLRTQREPDQIPERNLEVEVNNDNTPDLTTARFGRVVRPPNYLEVMSVVSNISVEQTIAEAMSAEIKALTKDDVEGETLYLQAICPELKQQMRTQHPLEVYKAVADPDTIYLHQAMKQPD